MANKIISFLLEGVTDKRCLTAIVNKYDRLKNDFHCEYELTTDLTSNSKIKESGIRKKIADHINNVLRRNGYRWTDIERIVQVFDLDGTYIPKDKVVKDISKDKFFYTEDGIRYNNRDEVFKRNGHKKHLLETLIDTKQINNHKYNVYFMSCNLEHVLWGNTHLNKTPSQKKDLSTDFMFKCNTNSDILNETIYSPDVKSTDYKMSWDEIKIGCNSLKRKTNINLFFEEYK